MTERKGVLTPNQENGVVELLGMEGMKERLTKVTVKLVDNQVIERLKSKIPEEYHEQVYEILDEVLGAFGIEK